MNISERIVTFANTILKKLFIMCTVSVNINEEVIRKVLPDLENTAAIGMWVQMLVDARLRELATKDSELMDVETMRRRLHSMVRDVYSRP